MYRLLCILVGSLSASLLCGNTIIPSPKKITGSDKVVDWVPNRTIFSIEYSLLLNKNPVTSRAVELAKNLPIPLNSEAHSIIIQLILKDQNLHIDEKMRQICPDSIWGKEEGYMLSIKNNQILAYGFDHAGLLYAIHSLRQLIQSYVHGKPITEKIIIDFPSFSFRGVMDDISRGPLSNMSFLKKQIERLSLLKINVVSYYTEHIIKTKKHFAYAPLDGITLSEFSELSTFADSFNIKIMGSFQSLGHFKNILSHPHYSHLGVSERMLSPGAPSSLQFLYDNYKVIASGSSHPFFNINCDEAYDLDRGPILADLASQMGKDGILFNHIYPLLQYVRKIDKVPAMWGDMLLKYPNIISKLPSETVILTWNYDDAPAYDSHILPFKDRGYSFVVCPGIVNSYRLWPDHQTTGNNISNFSYEGWKHGALGILTTLWDDGGRHFFGNNWYNVAIAAEHSWNPQQKLKESFATDFYQGLLQGRSLLFQQFLRQLQEFNNIEGLEKLNNSIHMCPKR